MQKGCTNHCSKCGRHFSSEQAFAAHRVGSFTERRMCADPSVEILDRHGKPRLVGRPGVCRVYAQREGFGVENDVTVWSDRKGVERARTARFPRA